MVAVVAKADVANATIETNVIVIRFMVHIFLFINNGFISVYGCKDCANNLIFQIYWPKT
jgi:hypothetical protein